MLVREWMSKDLYTTTADDSLAKASRLMNEKGLRHLPVVDSMRRLVGVISDRDLKRAGASQANTLQVFELAYLLGKVKVAEFMNSPAITIGPNQGVDEAAALMMHRHISCLPVVNSSGGLLGILTQDDLFRALVVLTGSDQPSVRLALELKDEPGSLRQACDVLRDCGARVTSILSCTDSHLPGKRRVFIRVRELDPRRMGEVHDRLSQLGRVVYTQEPGCVAA